MTRLRIGHMCIVDDKDKDELIGIVSFEDFVPTVNFPATTLVSQPVWNVASKKSELFVCNEDTLLEELIDLVLNNRIGAIPVVEKRKNLSYSHPKNTFDEFMNSLLKEKRSMLFIPPIRIDSIEINRNINFLNPSQIFQAQNYLNTLLSNMSDGRISKILLLVQRNKITPEIFAIGINKEYNRKLKEELIKKRFVDVKVQFKKFNEMLNYISKDKRIGIAIVENENKDLFNYKYILKGIIAKRELFKAGLDVIKIVDNLTV